ncbi:MAG: histidine phosphatase family protein [Candidatus Beckwithbacteria bacterium]|nr:histidine phosphatase family protein [Patescibacteria group bacterium]
MTIIYLARHGEYENPDKIIPFRTKRIPLSKKGKAQSNQIAHYLFNKNITVIYSSPLLRTKQTAEIIAEKLNLKLRFSKLILETRSPFQGMNLKKFKNKKFITFRHPYHIKNKGETLDEIFKRANKLFQRVLEKHKDQNVLLVSHGDPCMAIIYGLATNDINNYFQDSQTYIPKGGLAKFDFENTTLKHFSPLNY